MLKLIVYLCVLLVLIIGSKSKAFTIFELTAICAVIVYRLFNIFYAFDYKGIGIMTIVVCAVFCYQTDEIRSLVFRYYKYVMIASSIIGIICYVSYYLHVGIPHSTIERGGGIGWINYGICYLMYQSDGLIRLNGLFEEPGWFGTWAAFFLCADNLNFKKIENIILFFAGCITFSLAFIMLIVIYFVLMNLNDWKKWVWIVIFAALYLFLLPSIKTGVASIDNILERMVITNKGLTGDNRHGTVFSNVYESTIHSYKILFGNGAGYAEYTIKGTTEGLASIKSYIVNYGIIGTVIIFTPLLVAALRESMNKHSWIMVSYVMISFISLYQRPYLFTIPYFILFICGMSYIDCNSNKHIDSDVTEDTRRTVIV